MNIALNEIGAAVLSNAVLVVPLAVLAAVICRLVERPAVAWCLWGLVLLKFVTPAWYPCVPSWTSSRLSSTPGVSSGDWASNGDDRSVLLSDQAQTKHVTLHAESSETSVNRRDTEDGVTGQPGLLSDVDFGGQRVLPVDDRTSDSASTVPAEIKIAADAAPPPPPLPQDLPDTTSSLRAGSVSARNERAAAPSLRTASVIARPERPRAPSLTVGALTSNVASVVLMLLGVWVAGACALMTLAGMRVRRFRKLLRQAEPASDELVTNARLLAAELGCRSVPSLRVTNGRVPPVLWGLGRRAVILLPRGLLDELDDQQRSALLAHELAHFARRDHWTRWFEFAVRCLYWWHPVAWWAGRRLREAEEQCCDAWVVRLLPDPRRYADALLKTVDFLTAARPVPTLATGITLRRSLRPFHRRLTMIIEQQPNPRLTWPARLCLLALAGIVLPASIVAIADEETGQDGPTNMVAKDAPPESATDERGSHEAEADEARDNMRTFLVFPLRNVDPAGAIAMLERAFRLTPAIGKAPTMPAFKADGNRLVVHGTAEELDAVQRYLAILDGPAPTAKSDDRTSGETITVVRAQYVLPQKVAEAFDKFIQQHGDQFGFLVSKVSGAQGNPRVNPITGQVMEDDVGMEMGPQSEFGGGAGILDPSLLSQFGGMMMGGSGLLGFGGTQSQLTIIATPEVQQHFGDFIKALSTVQQPKPQAEPDNASETLTLTRVHYNLPVVSPSQLRELVIKLSPHPNNLRDPARTLNLFNEWNLQGVLPGSVGLGVWNILAAVKDAQLVPLLLVSGHDDRLTVTTTEDFQQALGKFIRFLQEHAPQPADDEQQQSRSPAERRSEIVAEKSRHAAEARRREAQELLSKAREALAEGNVHRARQIALEVQKSNVQYELFSDRPELVLAEIAKMEAAGGDESTPAKSRTGRLMFGLEPLSELRDQERELSALLGAIEEARKEEANRTLLLLAINQFYGDNAGSRSLIEKLNKVAELETEKQNLVQVKKYGAQHPKVLNLQAQIDTYRRSIGLPTGEDAKPLDLLDAYVKALQRQLDVTRKVIDALENGEKQSQASSALDSQIAALEAEIRLHEDELRLIDEWRREGGELYAVKKLIEYYESDATEKAYGQLNGDADSAPVPLDIFTHPFELIRLELELRGNSDRSDEGLATLRDKIEKELAALGARTASGGRRGRIKTSFDKTAPDYLLAWTESLRERTLSMKADLANLKERYAELQKAGETEGNLKLQQPEEEIPDAFRDSQPQKR